MDQMVTGSGALTGKPKTLIEIDLSESPYKNDMIHNRWHPDIPIVAWVKPGDDFVIQTYDWTGGFIKNNESADDVRDIDLTIVHFLSGPIGVEGAEPGDLYFTTRIMLPDGHDADLEALMHKWRDGHPYNPRGDMT